MLPLCKEIYPFLAKRGLDEEFFLRLARGELAPKPPEQRWEAALVMLCSSFFFLISFFASV